MALSPFVALLEIGLSPVPINPKTKRPPTSNDKEFSHGIAWSSLQNSPVKRETAEQWGREFGSAWAGVVCGRSSQGLEVIDFDVPGKHTLPSGSQGEPPAYRPWREFLEEQGFGDILSRLVVAQTPSGGVHVLYRCSHIEGNLKLAAKADKSVLIETRGQGGLIVCAPSPGYEWIQGDFTTLPTLTADERDILIRAARLLDESITADPIRPGDEYERLTSWDEILEPRGWQKHPKLYRGQTLWTRPGKPMKDGASAKTGDGGRGDYFYCFSTSAGLPTDRALSKFSLYTHLEHNGDFKAAARALAARGLGKRAEPEPDLTLPEIETVDRSLTDMAADAYTALLATDNLYIRAGELCTIATDERGVCKIAPHSPGSLRNALAETALYYKSSSKSRTRIPPPKDIVEAILSRTEFPGVRPIRSIVSAPVLGSDGIGRLSGGYDPSSLTYIASSETWTIAPCGAQESARWLLSEVLGDFPFATPSDAAHALGLMLLPFVRPLIDGPTPLHLIDAPTQGTGKSLLARVCLIPAAGIAISATAGTRDEEEWRKKIASALLEGRPYVFLDNLSRKVDSDALAAVLLSREWNDRALGRLGNVNLPVSCLWLATANNAELSRDITRRTVWIRLDSQVERPEDRTGFRHPSIETWVASHRKEVVAHILGVLSAWIASGRPLWPGTGMGGFEVWRSVMGGILESAGVEGFLANLAELRAHVDAESEAWGGFYERWHERHGGVKVLAKELLELFEEDDELSALLGDRTDQGKKIRFGTLLTKRVGVVARGLVVERTGSHGNAAGFRLRKVEATLTNTHQISPKTNQADQVQMVSVGESFNLNTIPTHITHIPPMDVNAYSGGGESDSPRLTDSPNPGDDLIDPYADEPDEEPDEEEAPYRWE